MKKLLVTLASTVLAASVYAQAPAPVVAPTTPAPAATTPAPAATAVKAEKAKPKTEKAAMHKDPKVKSSTAK